mmetsp:Transcript_21630/g.50541  ORF Transcript_21630/g.50541 Transcript_21630/m.50541 type:complete len:203 (+) Transcript_21630:50-658(+)
MARGDSLLLLLVAVCLQGGSSVLLHRDAAAASALDTIGLRACDVPDVATVCADCPSASGIATSQNCEDLEGYCSCCKGMLQDQVTFICSSFARSGDCVEDIKAAIQLKKEDCIKQQAAEQAARQQQYDDIETQVGDIFPNLLLHGAAAELGPFDSQCSDSCVNSTLCGSGGGCNQELWQASHRYNLIVSWSQMYDKLPCYHG